MATCNLCPPGRRDVPDDEMAGHLRTEHPEVAEDGTTRSDGSTIVRDGSLEPVSPSEDWRE
ncbi:hypothetical protein [Actinoplanes sp. NPDC049802]|uniref:hypothetical protein n=1 Tax=Actinoplanes sp. NPDC049802 TaxID=3154742 RepID=UPI0033C52241